VNEASGVVGVQMVSWAVLDEHSCLNLIRRLCEMVAVDVQVVVRCLRIGRRLEVGRRIDLAMTSFLAAIWVNP